MGAITGSGWRIKHSMRENLAWTLNGDFIVITKRETIFELVLIVWKTFNPHPVSATSSQLAGWALDLRRPYRTHTPQVQNISAAKHRPSTRQNICESPQVISVKHSSVLPDDGSHKIRNMSEWFLTLCLLNFYTT